MKTFCLLATICLLGVAAAAPRQPDSNLMKDFEDFLKVLPKDKVAALSEKYDIIGEYNKAFRYFHSKEFEHIWDQLSANKEFRDIVFYLNDAGLPINQQLNAFAQVMGLPPFSEHSRLLKRSLDQTSGWVGYFEELNEILPKEEIKILFNLKMATNTAYAKFYHKIASEDFHRILQAVKNSPELIKISAELRAHDIDVVATCLMFSKIVGLVH